MFESRAGYAHALAGAGAGMTSTVDRSPSPVPRNTSVSTITTRAMPDAGPGIERSQSVSSDEDIILVTVRLTPKDQRASYDESLPERPPKRSFFKRVSTRIVPPPEDFKYRAVKMPRAEYKRHFARDQDGNYAGSEPQRDWDDDMIQHEYGRYQAAVIASRYNGCAWMNNTGAFMNTSAVCTF